MKADGVILQVQTHRAAMDGYRTFPDAADCTWFAVTELGELVDANLRADPRYQRNNARTADPGAEAADLLYMIGSAYLAVERHDAGDVTDAGASLAEVADRLAYALASIQRNQPSRAASQLWQAIEHALIYCYERGWNPEQLLAEKMQRDSVRYIPHPTTPPAQAAD